MKLKKLKKNKTHLRDYIDSQIWHIPDQSLILCRIKFAELIKDKSLINNFPIINIPYEKIY